MNSNSNLSLVNAAEQGDCYSLNQLGLHYHLERNYEKAINCFKKAANQGFAPAQTNLARAYQCGEGVETDASEAIRWWQSAAEQEYAEALFRLGWAYSVGYGNSRNQKVALSVLLKAANQRHPNAEFSYGRALYHGWGGEQDLRGCLYWYRRAAIHGHHIAQYYMGQAHEHIGQWFGEYEVVVEDLTRARFWYSRAASQGCYLGQLMLGLTGVDQFQSDFERLKEEAPRGKTETLYQLGLKYYYSAGTKFTNVPQDYKQAIYWIQQAARKGNSAAQNQVGLAFRFGNGVPQDYDEAARWFAIAAEQELADAQFNLARSYRYHDWNGSSIKDKMKTSAQLFLAAAEKGHLWAQLGIGKAYVQGEGLQSDYVRATAWYLMALNQGFYEAEQSIRSIASNLTSTEFKQAFDLAKTWSLLQNQI